MGRYWDNEGPHQAEYEKMHSDLVPMCGPADTLEGELLRAAGKLGHEFYNNGGGNNVSCALNFLKSYFPAFDQSWWYTLAPYVTGQGGRVGSDVYDACEAITDSVVTHILSKDGQYSPSPCDMWTLQVKENGLERITLFDDEDDDYLFDDEDEEFGRRSSRHL